MEAMLGAVAAVPVGDMPSHRHPLGRYRKAKEQLLEVGPVIATVAEGDEGPLRVLVPFIDP
jgi:hypothetical protein